MKRVFVNNAFLEEDEAVLRTADLALQRGYGVFDFFRTRHNQPLFLEDYLDRLFHSAEQLFIPLPLDRQQLREAVFRLMEMNRIPESGIRITVTGGYSPDGYVPATEGNIVIQQQPLTPVTEEKWKAGMKIMTYPYQRELPGVKSINYLMGVWLQKQLKEKQLDDVLYVQDGILSEFPRSNVFIVTSGGQLLTPGQNVLPGITRKKVLEIAPAVLPVAVRGVSSQELKNAAEVFMTSTTKRILPVVAVNGEQIGNGKTGEITALLYRKFLEMEERLL